MAILKFTPNTNEIFENYDEEFGQRGKSFEALFKDEMLKVVDNKGKTIKRCITIDSKFWHQWIIEKSNQN